MKKILTIEYAQMTVDIYSVLYKLPEDERPYFSYYIGETYGIYLELYPPPPELKNIE